MICFHILPENYQQIKKISFTKDKKFSTYINLAAFAVAVFLVLVMRIFVPFDFSPNSSDEVAGVFLKSALLCVMIFAYIILHEAVHGIFIRIISGKWGKFGFRSGFAYASSEAMFGRLEYIIIALAPIVIWGIVLGIVNMLVPFGWFWVIYVVQIINLSGAVGDVYMTYAVMKLPKESLFKDDGLDITVYAKTNESVGEEI